MAVRGVPDDMQIHTAIHDPPPDYSAQLERVRQAFADLPATVTQSEDALEWVSIEHELVDFSAGVLLSNVSDGTIATLLAKFPLPRSRERIAAALARI